MKTRIVHISLLIGSLCLLFLFAGCDMFNTGGLAGQIFYDNDEADFITGTGYIEGAGPFIVPDDYDKCQGANVKISAENNSGSPVVLVLALSFSESEENDMRLTLQAGEIIDATYLIRLNDIPGGTNLRLWHNDSGEGTEDLTGVTISADVTYWLFNISAVN